MQKTCVALWLLPLLAAQSAYASDPAAEGVDGAAAARLNEEKAAAGRRQLLANAKSYLQAIEARHGRLSNDDIQNKFQRQAKVLEEKERIVGQEQVKLVRDFVIEVGPWLGCMECAQHGPLHEVLIRADKLLGLEDEADQDQHPYRKAKVIIGAMRRFTQAVIDGGQRGQKDEL